MNHSTFQTLVDHYIAYLVATGHRIRAVAANREQLEYFVYWTDEHPLVSAGLFGQSTVAGYVDHLFHGIDLHTGEDVTIRQRRERMTKLRRFLRWIQDKDHVNVDLSTHVPLVNRRGHQSTPTTKTLTPTAATVTPIAS